MHTDTRTLEEEIADRKAKIGARSRLADRGKPRLHIRQSEPQVLAIRTAHGPLPSVRHR
jgi:hypothetical protein